MRGVMHRRQARPVIGPSVHILLVAGLEEYPEEEAYFTPGDKLEATTVIDFLLACFGDDPELAEFFVQELHDLGAWEVQDPKFDLSENDFVPSAKIIPLDRRSDN